MSTYLKAYQDRLQSKLQKGGSPEEMAACVDEFNAVGVPDAKPTDQFFVWMKIFEHDCSSCSKSYVVTALHEMTDEQTCSTCLETKP